jgi:hypothetical protein
MRIKVLQKRVIKSESSHQYFRAQDIEVRSHPVFVTTVMKERIQMTPFSKPK